MTQTHMKIAMALLAAAGIGFSAPCSAQDAYPGAGPGRGGVGVGPDYRDGYRYKYGYGDEVGYPHVSRRSNEYADRDCQVEIVRRSGRTIRIHRCY